MRPLLLLLPLLCASSAQACLNDRDSDSLALQAAQFPDTLRVITGRFERNPPLFYQMRIQRSLAELKKNPRDFGKYDDIAVAFDKLHRGDEALAIMVKKRALLPPFNAKNPAGKEAWYRYFANTGTFHAHRFMGRKTADLSEMKLARAMIARAIEIKPNAHFGREKYQLMAMDWILAVKAKKTNESLGYFIQSHQNIPLYTDKNVVEGLSGLIVLGAAWESVDIFYALARSLSERQTVALRYLALKRCQELLQNGHKSLATELKSAPFARILDSPNSVLTDLATTRINQPNKETLNKLYPKLRSEAETWVNARDVYMLSRLQKGRHPDIDPTFWNQWKPATPPSLDVKWVNVRRTQNILTIGFLLVLGATIFGLRRRSRRKRQLLQNRA